MPEKLREDALQHMDWKRALANQKEEQLRAFLADYPADLRKKVQEMHQALEAKDYERLQEAAQQVMGSASFIGATQLHNCVSDLVEAIDLESKESYIVDKTARAAKEAEELERELVRAGFAQDSSPAAANNAHACCALL
ncbi:unnamed protein product [Durusdinium trenchii]|uniref:Uncharacterized protein n=2 Tax=Durusdinium trenchii TaxID=1381693 RepID=A0ABP0NCP4_9DINO